MTSDRTRRSVVGVAIAGVAAISLAALAMEGGVLARLALLVPLAVLVGGLRWSAASGIMPSDATATAGADETGRVDASAELVTVPMIEPCEAAESSRMTAEDRRRAAASFDLDGWRVDESPDRPQCAECGRFRSLQISKDRRVLRCKVCASRRRLTRVQPDTLVRLFVTEPIDLTTIDAASVEDPSVDNPTAS